ncbi:MAG: penicillin-binding transpeptidase domain-containing protein [Myxococcota bacterium]|nr:penicillin-binding transpeptidase domain-containing protein [Myxococcota bacterium]
MPAIVAGTFVSRMTGRAPAALGSRPTDGEIPSLAHSAVLWRDDPPPAAKTSPVAGLDLTRIASVNGGSTAPTDSGMARLTLDDELQRTAVAVMATRHLPEAAVVLMDVASGRLLVYASHIEGGPARDLCAQATAPSASVFKIVTAAALVEDAHLGPETKQCYLGGEQRISPIDLIDDPQRDKWCTTLASAMGRSINTVFARLASGHLEPEQLETMARRFGYGQPFPFDVPVQTSALRVPEDTLEFARTAAGFWNTTLSPLEAAQISAIVARGGESVRPSVVDKIVAESGAVLWSAPESQTSSRAIARDTADKVAAMMEHTVNEGTSWHAFHDPRGVSFLPGIAVGGKTGTLTDGAAHRYYTWFTGFAPMKPISGVQQVAISVLVVNGPTWQVKANVVARDMLRAYFASRDLPGVTRPGLGGASPPRGGGRRAHTSSHSAERSSIPRASLGGA